MATIKIPISNMKLPFYSPCEIKCRMQNGVSTVRFLNNIEIVREWELLIMGEREKKKKKLCLRIYENTLENIIYIYIYRERERERERGT